jgi:hypothetical protein
MGTERPVLNSTCWFCVFFWWLFGPKKKQKRTHTPADKSAGGIIEPARDERERERRVLNSWGRMGETSPDSVFANIILTSLSPRTSSLSSGQQPNTAPLYYQKSNPYPYMNQPHQQQQQPQLHSSSSYDPPFLNLPSQRSTSAPLESNHPYQRHHRFTTRPTTPDPTDVFPPAPSHHNGGGSHLWGGGVRFFSVGRR